MSAICYFALPAPLRPLFGDPWENRRRRCKARQEIGASAVNDRLVAVGCPTIVSGPRTADFPCGPPLAGADEGTSMSDAFASTATSAPRGRGRSPTSRGLSVPFDG